jgi:hypothetical protein
VNQKISFSHFFFRNEKEKKENALKTGRFIKPLRIYTIQKVERTYKKLRICETLFIFAGVLQQ